MNKPYSTKALPAGTVLREWRLEEVLGVGGFGIVYKGRGIYFDELVAIKEYFPSSIAERRDGDTVVPIDSDAEEIHALGLKKFVEEAKLLWNLSTPTRHPNIVSVRSLFEIHGTAYMVMDFEDGVSLSRLLKSGRKFTEGELLDLVRPIAEGLERAHRVGVLHRDIKPPNILINDDGRPVLIDFGSARFDANQATSTTVTFHTPPYAAIEQYVKTYEQGPWTDIYALGVVLHECVTGEKPPEVLERLHGGLGKNLAEGNWPGFSQRTLKAIDAAMIIRPDDRPKSIGEWLRMFDEDYAGPAPMPLPDFDDDDATRIVRIEDMPQPIVPVNAPPDGVQHMIDGETDVPDRASQASFKLAGEATGAWPRKAAIDPPAELVDEPATVPTPPPVAEHVATPENPIDASPKAVDAAKEKGPGVRPALIAGIGAAAIAIFVGGFFWAQSSRPPEGPTPLAAPIVSSDGVDLTAVSGLSEALLSLATEARNAGAGGALAAGLDDAATDLTGRYEALAIRAAEKAQADELREGMAEMNLAASQALEVFSTGLLSDAQQKSRTLARTAPWTVPGSRANANERKLADKLQASREALTTSTAATEQADGIEGSLTATRAALTDYAEFVAASTQATRLARNSATTPAEDEPAIAAAAPEPTSEPAAFSPAARITEVDGIVASAKDLAARVIAMGEGRRPGSKASDSEKANYELRKDNADRAKQYVAYLDRLAGDIRKAENAGEAKDVVSQANKYKGYLVVLLSRSTAAQ